MDTWEIRCKREGRKVIANNKVQFKNAANACDETTLIIATMRPVYCVYKLWLVFNKYGLNTQGRGK